MKSNLQTLITIWLVPNCGTVYPKTETKIEPEISTIKEPSDGKPSRVWAVEGKKGRKRGTGREKISNSRRVRTSSWELSDQDLQNELKSGGVLLAYSSSDPII